MLTSGALIDAPRGGTRWRQRGRTLRGHNAPREGRHPRRRSGHAPRRGDRAPAEADGRDRRTPDPLAHHEALRPSRLQRVRRRARLPRRGHQAVLPRLRVAERRPDGPRSANAASIGCTPRPDDWTVHLVDTGLDTNTGGRVGRLAPWLARRAIHADLRRRRLRRRPAARCSALHRGIGQARDRHGRPARRPASAA